MTRWVPSPRYLLRKQCVLRLLRDLEPGRVLEIGCAQGDMLRTLGEMSFTGMGVDLSEEALQEAREVLKGFRGKIEVDQVGTQRDTGPYDYVMSFEVLEHIRDDLEAVREWRGYLKEGGRLILSVPSNPKKWGPADEAVGHYRRYTKPMIRRLMQQGGFQVEHLWCYGFPIGNLSGYLTQRIYRSKMDRTRDMDMQARSSRSGWDRSAIRPFRFLWMNRLFKLAGSIQRLFLKTDWGTGYVIRARAIRCNTPAGDQLLQHAKRTDS